MSIFKNKASVVVKQHDEEGVKVGVWLSKKIMDEINVKEGDFVYASIGWSGSKSFRAVVKGVNPDGYGEDEMPVTADRLYEGNMKVGERATIWLHDNWS